ncbi:hypothetical protein QQ045_017941 [Rhodiola kirilowii]
MVVEKYALKRAHSPGEISVPANKLSKSWRDILNIVKGNSEVAMAFRDGLKLKLGNGGGTLFWQDAWLGDRALKDQYPKLFSLSLDTNATVQEMGSWVGGVWKWRVIFRRPLYLWEEVYKSELEEGLKHVQLKGSEDDRIIWTFSEDGAFSSNSLMKAAMMIRINKKKWDKLPFQLWLGVAPPKVEMLVWRIYLESLPTKVLLQREEY